jgi:hypothetical protein
VADEDKAQLRAFGSEVATTPAGGQAVVVEDPTPKDDGGFLSRKFVLLAGLSVGSAAMAWIALWFGKLDQPGALSITSWTLEAAGAYAGINLVGKIASPIMAGIAAKLGLAKP